MKKYLILIKSHLFFNDPYKSMTQKEYDEYQDFIEDLQAKKISDSRLIRKMIMK